MSTADYEKLLKQGDNLANQGKLDDAFKQYVEARNLIPQRQEARKQIINMALKKEDFATALQEYLDWSDLVHSQGKSDEALKILQDAIALEGQYEKRSFLLDRRNASASKLKEHFVRLGHQFYERIGTIYHEKNDYNRAIEFLDKAVEASPKNTKAHCLLGICYLAKGQLDKAKGPFQEVVRFQGPEAAVAYEKLAEIYQTQGNVTQMVIWLKDAAEAYAKNEDFASAAKSLEKIVESEPGNKDVLVRLGDIYSKEGNVKEAVRIYKQLAEVYSQAGLFDKVIVLYEKLVDWEPDNHEFVNQVVDIYRQSLKIDPGNLQARIKLIENLLRKGSVDEVVPEYLQLVNNYVNIGLLDEAINCSEKVLSFEPNNTKAREILADLYAKTGKSEQAGKELVTLGDTLRDKGDETKASEYIHKAMELVTEKSPLHLKLADDYVNRGAKAEALEEYQKVLAEHPDDPMALWQCAQLLFDLNKWDESEVLLNRLLELEQKGLDIKRKLVEIHEAQLVREMEEFGLVSSL